MGVGRRTGLEEPAGDDPRGARDQCARGGVDPEVVARRDDHEEHQRRVHGAELRTARLRESAVTATPTITA